MESHSLWIFVSGFFHLACFQDASMFWHVSVFLLWVYPIDRYLVSNSLLLQTTLDIPLQTTMDILE